jgi:fumarate reductase flavoprotein subunit
VELRLGHRVVGLITDPAASFAADAAPAGGPDAAVVRGVRVDGPEGVVELRAPAVVLTTGGYGADPALFGELSPDRPPLVSSCWPTATGDGLRLAREHGAVARGAEHQRQGIGSLELVPGSGRAGARVELNPRFRDPGELYVDADGRRFLAEDEPSSHVREQHVMALPDQAFWVVFDERSLEQDPCLPDLSAAEVRELAQRGEVAWVADDLTTLAQCAGMDPAGLTATVAAWNALGPDGDDPLGRTAGRHPLVAPPFYAARVHAVTVITFGGVGVDEQLRVVRADGSPIAGLYAAGELLGAGSLSGDRFWGGMALTPALALGRTIGQALPVGV